jgi:hypothetical protein
MFATLLLPTALALAPKDGRYTTPEKHKPMLTPLTALKPFSRDDSLLELSRLFPILNLPCSSTALRGCVPAGEERRPEHCWTLGRSTVRVFVASRGSGQRGDLAFAQRVPRRSKSKRTPSGVTGRWSGTIFFRRPNGWRGRK